MGADWLKAWVNPAVWFNPTRWDEMYDVSGNTAKQEAQKKQETKSIKNPAGDLAQQQATINSDSSEKARQLLISGNPQRLVASSGLSGNTSSGSSARRRLLGA